MPTRTTIFATNDNVSANDLNGLAGAWNSYTPTLGGFTKGNGSTVGKYLQFGKLVIFRAYFSFGSTSAAASAPLDLGLPVTAASATGDTLIEGQASLFDYSASIGYEGHAQITATGVVSLYRLEVIGSNLAQSYLSTTAPFTWATNDLAFVSGIYEAA